MKALIVGCGKMGIAAGHELNRRGVDVHFADIAHGIVSPKWYNHVIYDANNLDALLHNVKFDVILGCTTYTANLELTKLAIKHGVNYCDLGGNNDIVQEQLALNKEAADAKCFVIPDCGLAPGLAPMIAAYGIESIGGSATDVNIYVGGLPQDPVSPFNYATSWSVAGLINEYKEKCIKLSEGKIRYVHALDDVEYFDLFDCENVFYDECIGGELEAFNTSGGLSTLCHTYQNTVENLSYKTVRYLGHADIFDALARLGMFEGEMRVFLENRLNKILPKIDEYHSDIVLVKVVVDGPQTTKIFRMFDCATTQFSAMARTTGFSIATIAYMLASGEIKEHLGSAYQGGVLPGEVALPLKSYLTQFQAAGFTIEEQTTSKLK